MNLQDYLVAAQNARQIDIETGMSIMESLDWQEREEDWK